MAPFRKGVIQFHLDNEMYIFACYFPNMQYLKGCLFSYNTSATVLRDCNKWPLLESITPLFLSTRESGCPLVFPCL